MTLLGLLILGLLCSAPLQLLPSPLYMTSRIINRLRPIPFAPTSTRLLNLKCASAPPPVLSIPSSTLRTPLHPLFLSVSVTHLPVFCPVLLFNYMSPHFYRDRRSRRGFRAPFFNFCCCGFLSHQRTNLNIVISLPRRHLRTYTH